VLAYWAGLQAQDKRRWGLVWGLSLLVSLVCGGLWGVGLSMLVVGAHALMGAGRWRALVNVGAAVGVGLSVAVGGWMVAQYQAHAVEVVARPQVMGVDQVERAVKAGEVAALGVSAARGGLVGQLTAQRGGDWFVVSPDPQWVEAPLWALWLRQPRPTDRLTQAAQEKGLLGADGSWAAVEPTRDEEGTWRATFQFLTYHLFDPGHLGAGQQAVVRSTAGQRPALGKVWPTLEAAQSASARADDSPKEVSTLKGGQVVTILSEDGPWVEIEYQGSKTGFVLGELLRRKDALPHRTFEVWVRGLFYGLFPWVLVLPFAMGGLMVRALRRDAPSPDREAGDLVLAWLGVSILGLGLGGSLLGQGAFVGAVPVALSVGLWLAQDDLWRDLHPDRAPLTRRLIGLAALSLLVILLHDLFKNPWLLITSYLSEAKADWDEKLRILERPYRILRFAFALTLTASLMSALAWGERILGGVGRFFHARFPATRVINTAQGFGAACAQGWRALRIIARPRATLLILAAATALLTHYAYLSKVTLHLTQKGLVDTYRAAQQADEPLFNMQQATSKACKHTGDCGRGQTCAASRCVDEGVSFYLRDYPQLTQNALIDRLRFALASELLPPLQQRLADARAALADAAPGEQTQRRADAEALQRQAARLDALIQKGGTQGRFFAVIPRKQLSQINSQFRLLFPESGVPSEERRNLAVLDNRSSQFVLVSNQLRPGEDDQNPLNRFILRSRPTPQYLLPRPIKFEKGLEVIGYDVVLHEELERHIRDPLPARDIPVGIVGKKLVVIYYFFVGDRDGKPADAIGVPGRTFGEDWQMFLHVDEGGNRINGDHYPGDGEFHTDTWVVGDYVRDIHVFEVETGSPSGLYIMWFGFFKGDQRLKVVEGEHQDNRAKLGQVRIQGAL
jgi:hypothetical protein